MVTSVSVGHFFWGQASAQTLLQCGGSHSYEGFILNVFTPGIKVPGMPQIYVPYTAKSSLP